MTTLPYDKLISADSHVMEPPDLWWNALGSKYGDRTPRLLDEYRGEKGSFFYSGYLGSPVQRVRITAVQPDRGRRFRGGGNGAGSRRPTILRYGLGGRWKRESMRRS